MTQEQDWRERFHAAGDTIETVPVTPASLTRRGRRRSWRGVTVASLGAAAVVATTGWVVTRDDAAPGPMRGGEPVVASEVRTVEWRGVTVDVPASWAVRSGGACGEAARVVVDPADLATCLERMRGQAGVQVFLADASKDLYGADWISVTEPADAVDGGPTRRLVRGPLARISAAYHAAVVVVSRDVVVVVAGVPPQEVEAVAATVSVLPER